MKVKSGEGCGVVGRNECMICHGVAVLSRYNWDQRDRSPIVRKPHTYIYQNTEAIEMAKRVPKISLLNIRLHVRRRPACPRYSEVVFAQGRCLDQTDSADILNIPICSAAMDTVTEGRLAIACPRRRYRDTHRNLPIEKQAVEVTR